ncbi:MAG: stage II sporulation protein R [Clostridia bacterium]|nr:stage II sporulation protein R [Clostridia bacterium]
MKKIRITFICCCIILFAGLFLGCAPQENEFLRIHVRANSNNAVDQQIKLKVRDEVVNYLTPIVISCNSKQEAIAAIKNHQSAVNQLIDGLLRKNGFNYTSKVSIREEQFPTRAYDGVTLEAGFYDAVIIELGSGLGDNWWCVVYPPLCFMGNEDISYRSKIYDIINGL